MRFDLDDIKSGCRILSFLYGIYDSIKSANGEKDAPDLHESPVTPPGPSSQTSFCEEEEESELLQQQQEEEEKLREEEEQEELDNTNIIRTCIAIGVHNLQSRQ